MSKAKKPAVTNVRLFRFQDKFLTDPMTQEEADEIMDGYPDEYEVYDPTPAPPVAEQSAEPVIEPIVEQDAAAKI